MQCKMLAGRWACGVAVGALALTPLVARAQDAGATTGTTTGTDTTTTTTTTTETTMTPLSSEPVQITGSVVRYYVDRSGYVTAMDVQTAYGIRMVRFSPGMGQRLYSTYPVGSQVSLWAVGSTAGGVNRWDVVSLSPTMPVAGTMMTPYAVSDIDLLEAEPYIMAGARMVTVRGTLRNLVTNERGEVLGLVVEPDIAGDIGDMGGTTGDMGGGAMGATGTGGDIAGGMTGTTAFTGNRILVRVPREVRHISPGHAGTERITPLFRNSDVEVTGYPEAPRYGVLSLYNNRIIASTITVNGRSVGALGFPTMVVDPTRALLPWDIGRTTLSPEEQQAMGMGYTTYNPNEAESMTPATMNPGDAASGTGTGGTTGGTGTGTDTGAGAGTGTGAGGTGTGTGAGQ